MASLVRMRFLSGLRYQHTHVGTMALIKPMLLDKKWTVASNRLDLSTPLRWMATFRSRLPDIHIPEVTFFDHVSRNFDKYGDTPALIFPARKQQYTFNELKGLIRRLGSGLTRHGFRQNDVCSLFMKNNIEYLPMVFAITNLGGIFTSSNPAYTPGELAHQLTDSGASYIMTTPDLMETVMQAVDKARADVKKIFTVGRHKDHVTYDHLAADDGTLYPDDVTIDYRNDAAFLLYSSGTTGLPKGVMLTHYNLVGNADQISFTLGYKGGDSLMLFLPMFHIFGLIAGSSLTLKYGDKCVIMERFIPKEFLENIQKFKINHLPVVPPVLNFLAKSDMVTDYDLSSINDVISGAAPLSADMQDQVEDRHKVKVRQGYGMTESPVITWDAPGAGRVKGSSGLILPNVDVKILDVETGEELGLNEEGEIVARGPQVMKGYLNNPQATQNAIRDGWLHTGDVGYVDETGRLFIVDRVKELIKYKAFQVAPAELEGILGEHADIADSGVVGVPDEKSGELPKAFVVMKPDRTITQDAVQAFVADRVADFKHLRGGVEFVKEIPRSASGKILRRFLRQM